MQIALRVLAGLLVLVLILTAGAFLLPRRVPVARSIAIDAPPAEIFPHVNSMQAFSEWSPWGDLDPELVQTFSGPDAGVGNRMEWTSDDPAVGSGSQTISVSLPDERVETELDFGAMGMATAWFVLEPEGDATEVTWGLLADMGNNPVGRYMGLMMDRWVGADYERGLAKLKASVEAE